MQPFEPSFAVTGVDSMLWPRAAEALVEDAKGEDAMSDAPVNAEES